MALTDVRIVFVDDGGVLNDNEARAPQWRRLLGEYLTPRLGGTPQEWSSANVGALQRSWARFVAQSARAGASGGVDAWVREDRGQWLIDMCEQVRVIPPAQPESYAVALTDWVAERVHAAIPGAIDAVRWLAARGLRLHTASGAMSWEIEPYLRGMGIREHFDRAYGIDLVDRFKSRPHYYEAILADSGSDPAVAVAPEDSANAREWAALVGVRSFPSLHALIAALD